MDEPRVYRVSCWKSSFNPMSTGDTEEGFVVAYSAADAVEQVMAPLRSVKTEHPWMLSHVGPVHPNSEEHERAMLKWRTRCGIQAPSKKEELSQSRARACSWASEVLSGALRCWQSAPREEVEFLLALISQLRNLGGLKADT